MRSLPRSGRQVAPISPPSGCKNRRQGMGQDCSPAKRAAWAFALRTELRRFQALTFQCRSRLGDVSSLAFR